jgi:hypothetical protein
MAALGSMSPRPSHLETHVRQRLDALLDRIASLSYFDTGAGEYRFEMDWRN